MSLCRFRHVHESFKRGFAKAWDVLEGMLLSLFLARLDPPMSQSQSWQLVLIFLPFRTPFTENSQVLPLPALEEPRLSTPATAEPPEVRLSTSNSLILRLRLSLSLFRTSSSSRCASNSSYLAVGDASPPPCCPIPVGAACCCGEVIESLCPCPCPCPIPYPAGVPCCERCCDGLISLRVELCRLTLGL